MWKFFNDRIEFWRYRNGNYENILSFIEKDNNIVLLKDYICYPDMYSGSLDLLDDRLIFSMFIENTNINITRIEDSPIENVERKMIRDGHRKKEKIVYTYYIK